MEEENKLQSEEVQAAEKNAKEDPNTKKNVKKSSENKSLGEKLTLFLKNIRAEFNKIVWSNKKELINQTIVVIIVSTSVGVIIMAMDSVLGVLLNLFNQYFGNIM